MINDSLLYYILVFYSYHILNLKEKKDWLFKHARETGEVKDMKRVKELNVAFEKVAVRERNRLVTSKMKDSSVHILENNKWFVWEIHYV